MAAVSMNNLIFNDFLSLFIWIMRSQSLLDDFLESDKTVIIDVVDFAAVLLGFPDEGVGLGHVVETFFERGAVEDFVDLVKLVKGVEEFFLALVHQLHTHPTILIIIMMMIR